MADKRVFVKQPKRRVPDGDVEFRVSLENTPKNKKAKSTGWQARTLHPPDPTHDNEDEWPVHSPFKTDFVEVFDWEANDVLDFVRLLKEHKSHTTDRNRAPKLLVPWLTNKLCEDAPEWTCPPSIKNITWACSPGGDP